MTPILCPAPDAELVALAEFTHFLPIAIAVGAFVFVTFMRRSYGFGYWAYGAFSLFFSAWLVIDLVLWTTPDYRLIVPFWNLLDLVNVIFFVFAWQFWHRMATGARPPAFSLIAGIAVILIQLGIVVSGNAVLGFDAEACEAIQGGISEYFKFAVESIIVLAIVAGAVFIRKEKENLLSVFTGSVLAFLTLFAVSSIVASLTGVFELELYAHLLLPVLLIPAVVEMIDRSTALPGLASTLAVTYVFLATILFQLFVLQTDTSFFEAFAVVVTSLTLSALVIRNAAQQIKARREKEELANQLAAQTEALANANERLKELDRAKTEFLSIASHQLRTPLAAIRGYASMIVEGDFGVPGKAMQEPLGRIVESGRLMANSIEDYLNVSRIEQGRMKYEMSDMDLAEVAKTVSAELTHDAERRGLTLSFATSGPLPVYADLGKVKQVVSNLIDNAIKYTEKGSIRVTTGSSGKTAWVQIVDTGVGIDPSEIAGLFEKFVRGRGAGKVNTSGTGLGLYVAKSIIEAQKGRIRIASEGKGKGSTFTVELPLK